MTHTLTLLAAVFLTASLARPAQAQQPQSSDPGATTAEPTEPLVSRPGNSDSGSAAQKTESKPAEEKGFIARLKGSLDRFEGGNGTEDPVGVYPRFGLTTGAGIAAGAGYRTPVFNLPFYADLSGVLSTKWYVGLDGRLRWPSPAPRWLEFWTSAKFRRFPQEDYFGRGNGSLLDLRTNYNIHSLDVDGEVLVNVVKSLQIGVDAGYFKAKIAPGTDPDFPSIEQRFTDATAPGLDEQPDHYVHYGLSAIVDYRDHRGNPRHGGYYRVALSNWDDRSLGRYDFRRFDTDVHHYIGLGARQVLVGHGGISVLIDSPGSRVPFYFYPAVGGTTTIRSFRDYRFRDENAMSIGAEYRFELMKYVQLLGFVDAGKVAPTWQDLDFQDLKKGYGGGARINVGSHTFLNVGVGTGGGEGSRAYFQLLPRF